MKDHSSLGRSSEETANILDVTVQQILTFLRRADDERQQHHDRSQSYLANEESVLLSPESIKPENLRARIENTLLIPEQGIGLDGFGRTLANIFRYSVNTSAPGFLDKLYSAPLPPGIAAELVLATLNTNVHVYQVSPVLTLIEKQVTKELSLLFGLDGPRSGGIGVQGGSASNLTSIVVARNHLYPETKTNGNAAVTGRLLLFTSAHGHYSVEKAAQALGLGTNNVITVPVDDTGRMVVTDLDRLITLAKENGDCPFYINSTAGTTVLGSFDDLVGISSVARKHNIWLHVDAAWGGGFVWSKREDIKRGLRGIERADSIATNPHKMLGMPVTCSFLLGRDMRQFQTANTLKAGYLFHDRGSSPDRILLNTCIDEERMDQSPYTNRSMRDNASLTNSEPDWAEPYDLADLTMQCGRRGDSLKFFMSLQYYGTQGYAAMVDGAYAVACHLAEIVEKEPDLTPVLARGGQPDCLQVCFYYTPKGFFANEIMCRASDMARPNESHRGRLYSSTKRARIGKFNTCITMEIARALIGRGFMVDFAPAMEGQEEKGSFFRVVVNVSTIKATTERLISELITIGGHVVSAVAQKQVPQLQENSS